MLRNKDFVGKAWKIDSRETHDDWVRLNFKDYIILAKEIQKPKVKVRGHNKYKTESCSYLLGYNLKGKLIQVELTPWRRKHAEEITVDEFLLEKIQ
jgi:hypothetical protein